MLQRTMKQLSTSILKKQVMGVTGLLLCGFLITHLAGNFLIMVSSDAFNLYAYKLTSTPLIYVAEVILLAIFLTHIGVAIRLTIENKSARPTGYYMKQPTGRGETLASNTMPLTGLITLVFLVLHLLHFRFGAHYETVVGGVEMRDLHRLVIEHFQSELQVAWYIIAQAALALHVSHGFWSAFQSIGFNHPKYTPALKVLAKLFALVVFFGFSSLPIYCYLQGVS